MTPMPTWWLVISAFAYVCLALVCISLIVVAVFAVKFLKEVSPKVVAIEKQVQELVKKVQELTSSVQQTVGELSGKAKGLAGSAEGVAQSASRQFERYSPFVIGSLTAIRLVSALSKARQGKIERVTKVSKRGLLSILPRRKPKTLLGKVIGLIRH